MKRKRFAETLKQYAAEIYPVYERQKLWVEKLQNYAIMVFTGLKIYLY